MAVAALAKHINPSIIRVLNAGGVEGEGKSGDSRAEHLKKIWAARRLHRATLVPPASGGCAADFGEGEELLTLGDALRCCESLPGDGGWPIDWDAVAAHATRDATLGLLD